MHNAGLHQRAGKHGFDCVRKVFQPVLLLDFHFPTAVASRGCGDVGITQRFPTAVGSEEKLAFVSPLSTARHFRSPFSSCDFLLLKAGKEFTLGFLHFDGGSGIGLESGLPFEREVISQITGYTGQLSQVFQRRYIPVVDALGLILFIGL